MPPSSMRPIASSTVLLIGAFFTLKALLHLVVVHRYGYHGDELYFIECGRHLSFGYVDHPPLIPWVARVADELGGGLLVLRLPAIAAGVGTMLFTALLVHEWRGEFWAQLFALSCLLAAPAHLRMGSMLNIPAIEVLLCTAATYLAARALARSERRTWLVLGLVLGLAIQAKHSSILWGAALVGGISVTPSRRVLATRWPWFGFGVATLIAAPNFIWQLDNHFATFEFMRTLRGEILVHQGRGLFVAGQLLYFHPIAAIVWVAGVAFSFTPMGHLARPFSVLFLTMFGVLVVMGGKPYYLASAYPGVLAAGGIGLARCMDSRQVMRQFFTISIAVTGLAFAALSLPLLPLRTLDGAIDVLFGWAVPPIALTHDLHGMYGWERHAARVHDVLHSLPIEEQTRASILTGTYSQASAINFFGAPNNPRAVSGHMTHFLWGPDGDRGSVLIAYGVPLDSIARHYRRCEEVTRIIAPLARPNDTDLPVWVCRGFLTNMSDFWASLRNYGHVHSAPAPRESARFR